MVEKKVPVQNGARERFKSKVANAPFFHYPPGNLWAVTIFAAWPPEYITATLCAFNKWVWKVSLSVAVPQMAPYSQMVPWDLV